VSATENLERKLDLLIALTRIGVRDQLERERRALMADDVSVVILRNTQEWVGADELKSLVEQTTRQSAATVKRRIAELVSSGALLRRGATRSIAYRSSGLLDI
jgi:hypothetical protein